MIKASQYEISTTDQQTYLVEFLESASLNEESLSFGFEPGVIFDESGNPLTESEKSVEI